MRHDKFFRRARGFTLIELLVVLVILGLLAGLVGPQVIKYLGGANTKAAKLQIEDFSTALDAFRLDMGRYPSSNEGLQALVVQPAGASRWNGPYLRKNIIPKDPWGNDYQYRAPGQHSAFDLYSLGADNAEGGDGENQDVVSWQ
ncbi:MAG: type II secretion system protein GspG [Candidatus Competibacteraceae bacterium]|nr:MAG: type II secretion system protein GspG [Candidatus Competibacteraceae bacterium]